MDKMESDLTIFFFTFTSIDISSAQTLFMNTANMGIAEQGKEHVYPQPKAVWIFQSIYTQYDPKMRVTHKGPQPQSTTLTKRNWELCWMKY